MNCSYCGKPETEHDIRTRDVCIYIEEDGEGDARKVVGDCIGELRCYDYTEWIARLKARQSSGYTDATIEDDDRDSLGCPRPR